MFTQTISNIQFFFKVGLWPDNEQLVSKMWVTDFVSEVKNVDKIQLPYFDECTLLLLLQVMVPFIGKFGFDFHFDIRKRC